MKRKKKRTSFREYLFLKSFNLIKSPTDKELEQLKRPEKLCGHFTQPSLNSLTMGQLAEIINTDDTVKIIQVITGLSESEIMAEPYERVVGYIHFVTAELKRIADQFKQLEISYSNEELQAGVKDLNFGIFGTIDWYARRMCITDHNEVMNIRWIRILQCAINDSKAQNYEKRYREIINKK